MNLTENDRLLIVQKKIEICRLSQDIIEMLDENNQFNIQLLNVKKKILEILSLLHIIGDFGEPSRDIGYLSNKAMKIVSSDHRYGLLKLDILLFCVYANAITIASVEKGIFKSTHGKIAIPGFAELGIAREADERY